MSLRNPFIAAFTLTASLLLPAGFQELGAGKPQVAQLVKPGTSTLVVGDALVKVSADKALVASGGIVKISLQADAEKAQSVQVALLVEEAQGSNGGRIESPPDTISADTVTLEAKPGGGPTRELAIRLRGFRGEGMDGLAAYGYYTILAMQPATAKKFEKLLRKAKPDDGSDFWPMWYDMREKNAPSDGAADDADANATPPAHDVALVEVRTRDVDPGLKITAPDKVHVGDTFTVTVELTNDGSRSMKDPEVHLETPSLGADYIGIDGDQVTIEGEGKIAGKLRRGESHKVSFQVTAQQTGLLGLYAQSYGDDGDDGRERRNALDAVEVLPSTVAAQ